MTETTAAKTFYSHTLPVYLSILGCLFFFCVTASTFLNPYVNRNFNRISTAQMHQMVNQRAHRPFVYRMLVPQIVYKLDAISPLELKIFVVKTLMFQPSMAHWMEQKRVAPKHFYRMVMTLAVMLASIGLFGVFTYLLARAAYESHPLGHYIALLAPVIGLAALPMLTRKIFIYDFTVLMLWTAWLWAAIRHRWIILLGITALAAFCKETAIFLIFVYAVTHYDKLNKLRYILIGILVAAIAVYIKLWIDERFQYNPGVVFQTHWGKQLTNFSILYFDIPFLMSVAGYVLLLSAYWKEKPPLLTRGLWVLVPLVVAYFFVGYPREYRVFYEFIPFTAPLIAHSMIMLSHRRRVDV